MEKCKISQKRLVFFLFLIYVSVNIKIIKPVEEYLDKEGKERIMVDDNYTLLIKDQYLRGIIKFPRKKIPWSQQYYIRKHRWWYLRVYSINISESEGKKIVTIEGKTKYLESYRKIKGNYY